MFHQRYSIVKGVKGHTGYYSCERCNVQGVYVGKRIIFPHLHAEKRTNETFRSFLHAEHHKQRSPLIEIEDLDIVRQFVIDSMHLLLLGHQKKLLTKNWTKGAHGKLSKTSLDRLSKRLINLSPQICCEFQRCTRSLDDLAVWKACEFRFFLLYAGPFILKDLLNANQWKHYMLLFTAVRLLSSNDTCLKFADLAQAYLERYVLAAPIIYGLTCQIMNMHLLAHLVDDIRYFKCSLSDINAFSFENALSAIKKRLRSSFKPLEQLCSRLLEEEQIQSAKAQIPPSFEFKKYKTKDGSIKIRKLKYKQFTLSAEPDDIVLLQDKRIVKIKLISASSEEIQEDNIVISGNVLPIQESAFKYPLDSSLLNIFQIKNSESSVECSFSLKNIVCKMICLKIYDVDDANKDMYAIPLLHCETDSHTEQ